MSVTLTGLGVIRLVTAVAGAVNDVAEFGFAIVGTVIGMVRLERDPAAPLKVGLGVIALAFVVSIQDAVTIPGFDVPKAGCFVETPLAMVGVGGVSGLLFGGTNVGVQLVAYLRSCDLSHGLFVGVVALVFLGLNGVKIGIAGILGLYPSLDIFGVSIGAILPAVAGVAIGSRLRDRVDARTRRTTVLGLLTLIGGRLVLAGVGVA